MIRSISRSPADSSKDGLGLLEPDPELQIIDHILEISAASGHFVDPLAVTNLFVGLKSKPLVLLVGPRDSGKIAIIQALAEAMVGSQPLRCQMMVGHSWWAEHSENTVQFTEAQAAWNSGKVIDLIREASLPINSGKMFLGCLTRISPAELNQYFSEVAYQLRRGQVMQVGSIHLQNPIPFPRNMFLVGTMDENQFRWVDEDFTSRTSLIYWKPGSYQGQVQSVNKKNGFRGESTFLRACLRQEQSAFQKLNSLLIDQRQALFPLFQTEDVFNQHHIPIPNSTIPSAVIYLANSWTQNQIGLFAPEISTNLKIAMDLAITQIFLLPIQDRLVESAILRKDLQVVFQDRLMHSSAFIANS